MDNVPSDEDTCLICEQTPCECSPEAADLAEKIIEGWNDADGKAGQEAQRYQDGGVWIAEMMAWLVELIEDWRAKTTK